MGELLPGSLELVRLAPCHGDAVLEFERIDREYFAASITDRGDQYFAGFAEGFRELLADQDAGRGAYYVVLDGPVVLGRVNLILHGDGTATLGYRVASRATGRGLATAAVRQLCALAPGHGLHRVVAAVSAGNVASRRVLVKAGFARVGPAEPSELGGKTGDRYERRLGDSGADGGPDDGRESGADGSVDG